MSDDSSFCPRCGRPINSETHKHIGSESKTKRVAHVFGGAVGNAADKLYETVGGTGHVDLKFRDLFSAVFKKHEKREAEEIFICGTSSTTPDIKNVQSEWPKPWVWSRVLIVLIATVVLLLALYTGVNYSRTAFPGLVFMGALAMPFAMLVFFFETNVFRNISLVETVVLFFLGGVACIVILNFLPQVGSDTESTTVEHVFNCFATGFVEEAAKVILIVAVFRLRRAQAQYYILNGMLIGAAIGAGAGVFESAGYIFYFGQGNPDALVNVMLVRGILSVGSHVAWGAAEGAALALGDKESRVEVGQVINPISLSMFTLKNPAFLALFVSCIALHAIWNIELKLIAPPLVFLDDFYIKHAVLVIAIWVIILVMLNRGIEQVNETASEAASSGALSD